MNGIFGAVIVLCCFGIGLGMECYVCENQDSNRDKCVKSTIQCRQKEDTCFTEIRYRMPPYWTPHGERYHFITKRCDTQASCGAVKRSYYRTCKRNWYDDWTCVECCQGDLCNYYVTMGADYIKPSFFATVFAAFLVLVWNLYHHRH